MRAQQYNRAASLFSALILLVQFPLLAFAGELSHTEHAIAAGIAETTPWSSSSSTPTLQSKSAGLATNQDATHPLREHPLREHPLGEHPLGLQTLSIEADWKKHADGTRLARIYQYDHKLLKSRLLVIDVNTKQVVSEQLINSVHLPLSADEIKYATSHLNASASLLIDINHERSQQSLEPITHLSGFDVKASIYEPTLNDHRCSTQRCVLFALVDSTLTVSSVEPLVMLSNGDVQRLQDTLP